eukprot:5276748-Alexandrium_andersonii.AAC.1
MRARGRNKNHRAASSISSAAALCPTDAASHSSADTSWRAIRGSRPLGGRRCVGWGATAGIARSLCSHS